MTLSTIDGFNLDKALDIFHLETIWGIQFTRREEVHSVTIVILNNSEEIRESIDNFLGFKVPRELYQTSGEGTRCGLVAFESSLHLISSFSKTNSILW